MNSNYNSHEEDEIDLLVLFRIIWRKLPLLILLGVIGGAIAFSYTYYRVTPLYKATAILYMKNRTVENDKNTDYITKDDQNASVGLVQTASAILHSDKVLEETLKTAHADLSIKDLRDHVSISSVDNTEVFQLSVTDPSPKRAAKIANVLAEIAETRIIEFVEGCSVKIIDSAKQPSEMDSPSYKKKTMLGAMIGIVLGIIIVLVKFLTDTSIKTEEDFENWPYPVIGVIPNLNSQNDHNYGGYSYQTGKKHK